MSDDPLRHVDVESEFWKAAAQLWPDIKAGVIAQWSNEMPKGKVDLIQPELPHNTNFPGWSIHTRDNHLEVVLTATLPLDDAWSLLQFFSHYRDHDCGDAAVALDVWADHFGQLLSNYFGANPPPANFPPFKCNPDTEDDDE